MGSGKQRMAGGSEATLAVFSYKAEEFIGDSEVAPAEADD